MCAKNVYQEQLIRLQEEMEKWKWESLSRIASANGPKKQEELYKHHVQRVTFEGKFNHLKKRMERSGNAARYFQQQNDARSVNEPVQRITLQLMASCYRRSQPKEFTPQRLTFLHELRVFLNENVTEESKENILRMNELIKREMYFLNFMSESKKYSSLLLGVRLRLVQEFTSTFKTQMRM